MSTIAHTAEEPELPANQGHGPGPQSFWILALGSIGVVYGDIGTSPLYAIREAVLAAMKRDGVISEPLILGVLSLLLWALLLVVTLKYVIILLNADNRGEGVTLSLMALAQRSMGPATFNISVLSAVESLSLVTPAFNPWRALVSLASHGMIGLITLGAVFLAVTGAEALYADLGHFGKKPVRAAWLVVVLPALAINYLGQRAMLLQHPERIEVPFAGLAEGLAKHQPHRVPGTAVFFTSDPGSAPTALMHNLKHYQVLHRDNG